MILYLIKNKSPLLWIIFHFSLGAICTLSPLPIIIWFYLFLITSVLVLSKTSRIGFYWLTCIIAYSTSFEILARMSKTSPYIPYELGKYLLFVLLLIGILKGYHKGKIGFVMLILLIPGLFLDISGMVVFKNIVANSLGPINISLAIIFFSKQNITKENLINVIRLLVYPLISVLSFVFIKTPNLNNIEFNLGANFETAGGFGSNQVSTVLGLGAFLIFLFVKNRWLLSGYRWLDVLIIGGFIFRGLLTFSRGGIIGGIIGILIVLIFKDNLSSTNTKPIDLRKIVMIISSITISFIVFHYADNKTGGQLSLRYQGETYGTLSGSKEKSLNTLTTNRFLIFQEDISLWSKYPLFGVGVGASSYLRNSTRNIAPHIEFSRLLSEHGIPGLIVILIFLYLALKIYRNKTHNILGTMLLAFLIIAYYTTFHAATRTYISPVLIGLALITVYNKENENTFLS